MAQELYELPVGWEWKVFNDVCINITDGAHASPKTIDEGFPYVTVRDVDHKGQIDTVNCKRISEEDFLALKKANCQPPTNSLLLSKDGTVGKVAHVTSEYEEFVVLSSLAIITPNQKVLEPEYLKYFLLSPEFQDHAIGSKTGAAIKRIVLRTIKGFKIPLVQIEVQKCLVKKLDALLSRIDTAIEHLEHSLELNNQLFASSLNQAFNPLDAKIQSDGTYQLPEGWEWKKLSKISSFFNGYAFKKNQYSENGMPLLRITNIQNGEVVKNNQIFIDLDKTEKKAHEFVVNPSDIVIAMSGATTGKVAINHTSTVFLQNQRVGRFVIPDLNLRDFVFYFLAHIAEENLNKAFGAAQPNLSTAQINSINVPLPNSSNLEKVITTIKALAKATKTNKQALQKKLEQLQQLKASLLDSAFRGEL